MPRISGILPLLLIVGCTTSDTTHEGIRPLRRSGREIVDEHGAAVQLRGVAFGNNVWANLSQPPAMHHGEQDFERLAGLGMNAVRFYVNYRLFEDDADPFQYKPSGWAWLDQNIAWAKAHGISLIVNMHVPPGGFQSNGEGGALWTDPAYQDRLVALWAAIAERYRDEPTIAGWDLLNEPRPLESREQWQRLADRIAAAIREVDPDHMLVVERTLSVGEDWSIDGDLNFFLVDDDNVAYEFHFYSPIEYTHQLADWTAFGEGGPYPDASRIMAGSLAWYDWNWRREPPRVPAGDSDWTYYESEPYLIDDPNITAAAPVLVSELNEGTVWFDDIAVHEYDAEGTLVRTVLELELETMDGWWFWTAGTSGSASVSREAHSGAGSLSIAGTDHDANLSNESVRFAVQQGHSYTVAGWMKGEAVSALSRPDPRGDWEQSTRAIVRLDLYAGELQRRDKAGLARQLDPLVAWGEAHDVPLFMGEFGAIRYTFEDDRGGLRWVADMLELARERGLHFAYHAYHEDAFGIFRGDPTLRLPDPANANQPLLELFAAVLAGP